MSNNSQIYMIYINNILYYILFVSIKIKFTYFFKIDFDIIIFIVCFFYKFLYKLNILCHYVRIILKLNKFYSSHSLITNYISKILLYKLKVFSFINLLNNEEILYLLDLNKYILNYFNNYTFLIN